eukprot:1450435-Pleurochrysis_carterae.AAC.3
MRVARACGSRAHAWYNNASLCAVYLKLRDRTSSCSCEEHARTHARTRKDAHAPAYACTLMSPHKHNSRARTLGRPSYYDGGSQMAGKGQDTHDAISNKSRTRFYKQAAYTMLRIERIPRFQCKTRAKSP